MTCLFSIAIPYPIRKLHLNSKAHRALFSIEPVLQNTKGTIS